MILPPVNREPLTLDGYGWEAIVSYLEAVGLSFTITSTVRPGDTTSRHGIGMAVDMVGDYPALVEAAAYALPAVFEGIWRGDDRGNLSVKRGEYVDPSYWGAATWAAHGGDNEHLHLACYIDATEGPGWPTDPPPAPAPTPADPWADLFVPILIGG